MLKKLLFLSLLLTSFIFAQVESSKEFEFLKKITEAGNYSFDKIDLTLNFKQPLDHKNPSAGYFTQRVFIKHADFNKPVVLHTEGYSAYPTSTTELTRILNCNEIYVEHRFNGGSAPEKIDWKYMTVQQAADDHHAIVQYFKQFYKNKWINTGVSKGGQTALLHRYFYPNDVDVTVAYVAPVNLTEEDVRIDQFLADSISTKENRDKITKYQRALLERRNEILPFVKEHINKTNAKYRVSIDSTYEYGVMEFSFAFWQYDGNMSKIPSPDADAKTLASVFLQTDPMSMFNIPDGTGLDPAMYQFYHQLGFYGYDTKDYKDLLKYLKKDKETIKVFSPQGLSHKFDGSVLPKWHKWLHEEASNIIYIYGGIDPWSATQVRPTGKTNSFSMVKKGGTHGTGIRSFEGEEREKILTALEKWLDLKIDRRRFR